MTKFERAITAAMAISFAAWAATVEFRLNDEHAMAQEQVRGLAHVTSNAFDEVWAENDMLVSAIMACGCTATSTAQAAAE